MSDEMSNVVRELLEAMCRKQRISLLDHESPAANFVLAQRLGIGSVFGAPDNEESLTEVAFVGGPWDTQTIEVERVVGPVFGVGHHIGNHYWLDTKSGDPPKYHWDGTVVSGGGSE